MTQQSRLTPIEQVRQSRRDIFKMVNRRLREQFIGSTVPSMSPPIQSLQHDLPIRPAQKWQLIDKRSLQKTYTFENINERNAFVVALLGYEQQVGHNANMSVNIDSVCINVGTHDLNIVTEIDREYARYCDVLYYDIMYAKS